MNETSNQMRYTLLIAALSILFVTTSCHKSDELVPSLFDDSGHHSGGDDKGGDNKNGEDDNPSQGEDNGGNRK